MSRFKSHRGRRQGQRHLPCLLIQSVSALSGDPDFAITFSEDMIFSGNWLDTGLVVANSLGPLTIVSVTQESTDSIRIVTDDVLGDTLIFLTIPAEWPPITGVSGGKLCNQVLTIQPET